MKSFGSLPRWVGFFGWLVGGPVLLIVLAYWLVPNEWIYAGKYREAGVIIGKIEQFKKERGDYPRNLGEVGVEGDESGPYFYSRDEDGGVRVWFAGGRGFFACQTYASKTREWGETD